MVLGHQTGSWKPIWIDFAVKQFAFIRILRTGLAYDSVDESPRLAKGTIRLFRQLWRDIIFVYGKRIFNHCLTNVMLSTIESDYIAVGFAESGCAIYCMHVIWKSFLLEERWQYHSLWDGKTLQLLWRVGAIGTCTCGGGWLVARKPKTTSKSSSCPHLYNILYKIGSHSLPKTNTSW